MSKVIDAKKANRANPSLNLPETQDDRVETPKLTPVQEFELVVNQYLMRKDMSPAEAVGFLELKLIEVKENWRAQVGQRIQAIQNQAANETKN